MDTDIDVSLPDAGAGATPNGQDGGEAEPQRDAAWYEKQLEDSKRRIGKLTARAKGAEEANEAERQARARLEAELADERRRVQQATQVGATFAERSLEAQLAQARDTLRRAIADGDGEAQATAMEAVAEVKAAQNALKAQQPQRQEQRQEPRQQRSVQQGEPPARTKWLADNPWFKTDAAKQAEAVRIHEEVASEGYTPDSPAYFREMTARTRDLAGDDGDDEPRPQPRPAAGSSVSRTVMPGQAGQGARATSVRLTADEVRTAEMLGMKPAEYAAEKLRIEQQK